VIGLIACAFGYGRDDVDKIKTLFELKFGVRVDKPGVLLHDYHTAKSEKSAYVTNRYYLSDAKFTVGLEGNDLALLQRIADKLLNPVWPLFLGRRSCPPAERVFFEIADKPLREALHDPESKWYVFDFDSSLDDDEYPFYRRDNPESFSQRHRKYWNRRIVEVRKRLDIEHDAFEEV
jgi:CRISPR system Cascade subunit CasD